MPIAKTPGGGSAVEGTAYPKGQRLVCEHCGSEIEVISPCTCIPPGQILRCCGADMKPSVGRDINLGVE